MAKLLPYKETSLLDSNLVSHSVFLDCCTLLFNLSFMALLYEGTLPSVRHTVFTVLFNLNPYNYLRNCQFYLCKRQFCLLNTSISRGAEVEGRVVRVVAEWRRRGSWSMRDCPTLNSLGLKSSDNNCTDDDFLIFQFELSGSLQQPHPAFPSHFIIFIMESHPTPNLSFLQQYRTQQPLQNIAAVPLEWTHLPADVVSKEFTQLNNTHSFRIHYLGPRPHDTLAFHKRYGCSSANSDDTQEHPSTSHNLYTINMQKLTNCRYVGRQKGCYQSTLFYRAFEGMNPSLQPNQELIFNGAFESGNLDCVIKVNQSQFDIFLRIDSNTQGHTGWYFFSIKNGHQTGRVTLNICNLKKPSPLYGQGMRPYIFSRKALKKQGCQWQQGGLNCHWEQSQFRYKVISQKLSRSQYYKLCFDYEFKQEQDEVFFAYCIPYTYRQLQQDLKRYTLSPWVQKLSLGRTLSGMDLPLLHITNHGNAQANKKIIIVTGRVHPGQTNGSHILRGFIAFLLGDSKQAITLRLKTHIFIVPMLNPDGVVLGNTRTSAAGKDLNREFINPEPELYPQCHLLKNFVSRLQRKGEIQMYLDIHGHSRRKNTFLYGPNYLLQHSQYIQCRLFPKLVEKINATFRYHSSNFFIAQDKRRTARAVMLQEFKIPFVYTVQSSIGLYYSPAQMTTIAFKSAVWEQMGGSICKGVTLFSSLLNQSDLITSSKKAERLNKKQRATSSSCVRIKKTQEEKQQFILNPSKEGLSSLYDQLIKEIKMSSSQMQNEEDSDDHDQEEDLPSYKLKEFKNHMGRSKPQQLRYSKVHSQMEALQVAFTEPICPPMSFQNKHKSLSRRYTSKSSKSSQIGSPLLVQNYTSSVTKTIDLVANQRLIRSRKSIIGIGKSSSVSRQQTRSITICKPHYSLATKNLFNTTEDRDEYQAIPKNIQIMRKEMKKGRLLIRNLEQSKLKFSKKETNPKQQYKKDKKGPFVPVDLSKRRMAARSSLCHPQYILNCPYQQQLPHKQSQACLAEPGSYDALEGLEVDNLAMKITTFKRR